VHVTALIFETSLTILFVFNFSLEKFELASPRRKDASRLSRAPLDFGIGAVISASLRPNDLWSSESAGDTIV
jgi:hypothetical protein